VEVQIPYTPREAFIEFHQRNTRFAAMCCHRRAGKTVSCIADLVIRAIYTKKPNARYAYVGPFRQQAKEIAWSYLKDMSVDVRKGPPRESDLRVTLLNGSTITIYGADNPDSLRGLYFDGMVIDEYGDCRPSLWGDVLLPTLIDRRGWAVFIGTMRGKNHFYQNLERARTTDAWFHKVLKASESGLISEEDLSEARAEMTDAQYQQEMECDPNAAVQGTYYANMISEMERDQRIGEFPYDPGELVHMSADLGKSDSTAFWFWQLDEKGPRIIDYEEHDGEELDFYFDLLNNKGYEYADIWLPHDAKAHTLATKRSTVEQFLDAGFPCKVVPKLAVQHGIDAARLILPQCRINKATCYTGIEALRGYRRQFNEKTQQYSNTPLHDWASNGADSFRYMSLVTETEKTALEVQKEHEPLLKTPEYCLEDLYQDQNKDDWRKSIIRI
jgi:phage terminase large subunit